MLESRRKSYAEKVSVSPLKKVTFYGPVSTTKGDRLRYVGVKRTPSKRTLFSSSPLSQRSDPAAQKEKSNEERPHSKTSVIGNQIKTRLNCNHTKPRCEACSMKKSTSAQPRHKTFVSLAPRQGHVLPSTRNFPRGGTDGRKLYDREDRSRSVSILNADWKPGEDDFSGTQEGMSASRNGTEMSASKNGTESPPENPLGNRQSSDEAMRKKVQFADKMNESRNSGNSSDVRNDNLKNQRKRDSPSGHSEINGSIRNSQEGPGSSKLRSSYSKSGKRLDDSKTRLSGNVSQGFQDTSSSDPEDNVQRNNDAFCSLCKSLGYRCFEHSEFHPRYSSWRERVHKGRNRTQSVPDRSSLGDDLCLLCRRYGKNHYYVDDEYCRLCDEAPYKHRYWDPDNVLSSSARNSRLAHHRRLVRPLHKRWSAPMFYSDGEEDSILQRNIPYEPKTEYVKDLKKKLEDEYKHREYLRRRRNMHRRWRSWDAEDLEELRNYRMHKSADPWEYIPQHKCVHHYMQNDRLFLEPTFTDEDGSSLCSECGAPKPKDPVKDPYLYHITLGGLRNRERYDKENMDRNYRDLLPPGKSRSSKTLQQSFKPSKRLPGDTSKHLYAKLNRNINNILPRSSHYSLRPHLADELRYRADPHTKRHPSRSMALVDHLV